MSEYILNKMKVMDHKKTHLLQVPLRTKMWVLIRDSSLSLVDMLRIS